MIASIALLLRHSLRLPEEAADVERALARAIQEGARTQDIALDGDTVCSTAGMTDAIIQRLR
jgi:3-isopropylmalate dehydrogenase